MKKMIFIMIMVFVLVSLNNCGGSNSNVGNGIVNKQYTKSIKLMGDQNTSIILKGNESDELTLSIPSLPAGEEDQNVTITLKYINDLPFIEIDKDIVFTSPVKLKFSSDNLQDGNTTLVYHASGTDYYVPSVVKDYVLEADLSHFSTYGFDDSPSKSDKLYEDINSRLKALDVEVQAKRFAELSKDQVDDLFMKIQAYEGDSKHDSMIKSYATSIALASHHTIQYFQDNEIKYFDVLCPTGELLKALNELTNIKSMAKELLKYEIVKNMEVTGSVLHDVYLSEAEDIAKSILEKSKKAWDKIDTPKCDNKSKLWEYIKCTKKYINDLETSMIFYEDLGVDGIDISEKVNQELEDAIASDAMEALSSKECDCMSVYLDTLNTYFANTQQDLIGILRDATETCGTSCPLLWDVTVVYNGVYDWNPDFAWSGSATWEDVYIAQKDDAWVELGEKERIACEPYKEKYKGVEPEPVSVTGDVEPDMGLQWLYVRVDDGGNPYIQLVDWNVDQSIYNQLNNGFQQFTVSASAHGTTTYTFTPKVRGYTYPAE